MKRASASRTAPRRLRFPGPATAGRAYTGRRRLPDRKRKRRVEAETRWRRRLSECRDAHNPAAGLRHAPAKHRVRAPRLHALARIDGASAAGRHQSLAPPSLYRVVDAARRPPRADRLSEMAVLERRRPNSVPCRGARRHEIKAGGRGSCSSHGLRVDGVMH